MPAVDDQIRKMSQIQESMNIREKRHCAIQNLEKVLDLIKDVKEFDKSSYYLSLAIDSLKNYSETLTGFEKKIN
jgi:hypothetical protein